MADSETLTPVASAAARAVLPRGEQILLQSGHGGVAQRERGRQLCGAAPLKHAPDNRPGGDGDEQGGQSQVQVHDGTGFTTLRPFFAGRVGG